MKKTTLSKYLKLAFKVLFVIAALWFVFSKIDSKKVFETIGSANPFILVTAILTFAISKVISAFRLKYLFDAIDVGLNHVVNLKLYWLCMFYNTFLPGGIGGDGYKVWWIQKYTNVNTKKVLGAVLLDRGSGVHAILVLAILITAFMPCILPLQEWYLFTIPLAYIVLWLMIIILFNPYKKVFFQISILSLIVQVGQVLTAFFVLQTFGIVDHYTGYLFIFLLSSIAIIVPISIGGIGLRELFFLYGAKWFGLDLEVSVALALTIYFITIIVNFSGVYFFAKPPVYNGNNKKIV